MAQTFQNFEVVAVDDCSTDNTISVVESYIEKFNGRLKVTKMKSNSGGAGLPRNKGMEIARGEYIYFIDSDDTVTPTALEELYSRAKEFDADVILCEKYYEVPEKFWRDSEYRKKLKPYSWKTGLRRIFPEPTFLPEDIEQRIKKFLVNNQTPLNVWNQLIRRDFLLENEIKYCNCYNEDFVFAIAELCCAKRYVIVPNVIYYYRRRLGSATMTNKGFGWAFSRQLTTFKVGIKYIDEFLNTHEVFSQRMDLKYLLFEEIFKSTLRFLVKNQTPVHELDGLFRKELSEGDNVAMMSLIFNKMNIYRKELLTANERIVELENELKNLKK